MNTKKFLSALLAGAMAISAMGMTAMADAELPKAEVTVLAPMVLEAGEHSVYDGSLSTATVDHPLDIVMNFKALESYEEASAGAYAKWKTDFYLTLDGLSKDTIVADDCYLAGSYGEDGAYASLGWLVIPTDGFELEEGVTYPIVSQYDPNLTYENVCDYVKEFFAAIYIDDEIIKANPDMTVTLELKMTNPDDDTDVRVIGEPAVYTASSLTESTFVSNIFQGNYNGTLEHADTEAAAIMSEIIMGRGNSTTITDITWELNGKSTSVNDVSFTGEGKVCYGIIYPAHLDLEVGDVVADMVVTY